MYILHERSTGGTPLMLIVIVSGIGGYFSLGLSAFSPHLSTMDTFCLVVTK